MKTVLDSDIRTDEALEELFANAAARPRPQADREEQIRDKVHAAWQQGLVRHRRRRHTFMALAASVAVAAIVGMVLYQPQFLPADHDPVAMVDKRFGELRISDASGVPYYPAEGRFAVSEGQFITTAGKSGLAMTWSNGGSLRLDEHTTISVASANEIYLQRGRLYFDSDPDGSRGHGPGSANSDTLAIRTQHGLVTPLGTRYVAQHMNNKLMVMVRDGEVSVRGADFSAVAQKGERMLVTADAAPSVVPVVSYGDEWGWIEKTTPAWNTEGRTIVEFLDWVSRESGRPYRFDSPSAERLAKDLLIGYGQVDLEPSIALRVVLMSTDLDWTSENGVVVVTEKAPRATGGAT
jgi:ferric-dicitrate binding protein FerR (iron transport regulator)